MHWAWPAWCPSASACLPFMPNGFWRLLWAQFLSGIGDNGLLLVAIAVLQSGGYPAWWPPLLKWVFVVWYVIGAPYFGRWADRWIKGRLMLMANVLKALACCLLLTELHPVASLGMVGFAAAVYAPAKYGWVTEQFPATALVKANAYLEITVILAVILGFALGGGLVAWVGYGLSASGGMATSAIAQPLWAVIPILLLYAVAAILCIRLPSAGPRGRARRAVTGAAWPRFWRDARALWTHGPARLTLAVTTWVWGASALIQFAVLDWARVHLGLSLSQGAWLQACAVLGAIIGAALIVGRIRLVSVPKLLVPLATVGPLLWFCSLLSDPLFAAMGILTVGLLCGVVVVPMNALLQYRGHRMIGAGQSIAVQGFGENLGVLVALSAYSGLMAWQIDVSQVIVGVGVATFTFALLLSWGYRGWVHRVFAQ